VDKQTVSHPPIRVHAVGFKRHEKNTLRGFLDLELPAAGIILIGATLHEKNGSRWIGLPARPYTDPQTGKTAWAQIIDFASKEARQAFQRAALRAVEVAEFADEVNPEADNGF
jgi:hypothetical protein